MLVQIDYELSFAAPFHLGTGISTNVLDRTVIRDAGKYLYVPASTFKGVLREHCEHLLRFYTPNEPESIASPHDANAALTELGGASTLISRIFGSQIHPGGLRFDNARQEETTRRMYEKMQTSVLTQVRIDRVTRTAANEALYISEFGAPFLTFKGAIKGQIDCEPIDDLAVLVEDKGEVHILTPTYSLLLLLAGLFMIERLGGNKSTGKGQCRCTIEQVLLNRHKCTEEEWRPWIEHLDIVSNYAQTEKGGQR